MSVCYLTKWSGNKRTHDHPTHVTVRTHKKKHNNNTNNDSTTTTTTMPRARQGTPPTHLAKRAARTPMRNKYKYISRGACVECVTKNEDVEKSDNEDEDDEEFDHGIEVLSEIFEQYTDFDDYAKQVEIPASWAQSMFALGEMNIELWPGHCNPDTPSYMQLDVFDVNRLRDFQCYTATWWNWKKPLALPPICFECPGSRLVPFKGLLMHTYRTVWLGLSESSSIEALASKFETMKLIMVAAALYSFVENLEVDNDHPIPDPIEDDGRDLGKPVDVAAMVKKEMNELKGRWLRSTRPRELKLLAPEWSNETGMEALLEMLSLLESSMGKAKEEATEISSAGCSTRGLKTFKSLFEGRAEDAYYIIMMAITVCTDFVHLLGIMGNNSLVGVTSNPYVALYYLGQQVREIMLAEEFETYRTFFGKLVKVTRKIVHRTDLCGTRVADATPAAKKKWGGRIDKVPWHPSMSNRKTAPDFNIEDPMHRVPYFFKQHHIEWIYNTEEEREDVINDVPAGDPPRKKPRLDDMVEFRDGVHLVTSIARVYADGTYLPSVLDDNGNPDYSKSWDTTSNVSNSRDAAHAAKSRKTAITKLRHHWAEHHNGQTLPSALQIHPKKGFGAPWAEVGRALQVDEGDLPAWIKRAKRAFKTDGNRLKDLYSKAYTKEQYVEKIKSIIERRLVCFNKAVPRVQND